MRDGSPCKTFARVEGGLCDYHAGLLSDGEPVGLREPPGEAPYGHIRFEELRDRTQAPGDVGELRQDFLDFYGAIRRSLIEAASAERDYVVRCGCCNGETRVRVPDWESRLRMVTLWFRNGFVDLLRAFTEDGSFAPIGSEEDWRASEAAARARAMSDEELEAAIAEAQAKEVNA